MTSQATHYTPRPYTKARAGSAKYAPTWITVIVMMLSPACGPGGMIDDGDEGDGAGGTTGTTGTGGTGSTGSTGSTDSTDTGEPTGAETDGGETGAGDGDGDPPLDTIVCVDWISEVCTFAKGECPMWMVPACGDPSGLACMEVTTGSCNVVLAQDCPDDHIDACEWWP